MKDLNIKKTVSSPEILTDYAKKEIIIQGESYPENPFKFYEPLIEFLTEYITIEKSLTLSIHLVYYNSSTTKVIYDILDMLDESDLEINVQWIYNESNELALENGEDYAEDYTRLKIELIPI
jgi:hypothetical protein